MAKSEGRFLARAPFPSTEAFQGLKQAKHSNRYQTVAEDPFGDKASNWHGLVHMYSAHIDLYGFTITVWNRYGRNCPIQEVDVTRECLIAVSAAFDLK